MPAGTMSVAFGWMILSSEPLIYRDGGSPVDKQRAQAAVFTAAQEFVGSHSEQAGLRGQDPIPQH